MENLYRFHATIFSRTVILHRVPLCLCFPRIKLIVHYPMERLSPNKVRGNDNTGQGLVFDVRLEKMYAIRSAPINSIGVINLTARVKCL